MPGRVTEWLDCGNKDATVYTNQRVLEITQDNLKIPASVKMDHAVVIPPCFIGEDVRLTHAVVGPHVSIGKGSTVSNSVIRNSIIQQHSTVEQAVIDNSMIGSYVSYRGNSRDLSMGDYTTEQ